jgi:hypothetical protein
MRVIVRRWIPDDPAKADAILEMVERKALELAGERASGLELTLACTAATVWAATQFRLASADQLGGEARTDRALKRYERLLLTLARVRKLKLATMQVNIATNQQVNNKI